MSETIDQIKTYLESPEGSQWLLSAIAGAQYQENQKRYYSHEEPVYNREREQDKAMEARKKALDIPIPVLFYRDDVNEMIKFNNEKHPGEWKEGRISGNKGVIIHRNAGTGVYDNPIIQYEYWNEIINQGEGIASDNHGQKWFVSLVE